MCVFFLLTFFTSAGGPGFVRDRRLLGYSPAAGEFSDGHAKRVASVDVPRPEKDVDQLTVPLPTGTRNENAAFPLLSQAFFIVKRYFFAIRNNTRVSDAFQGVLVRCAWRCGL